MFSYEELGLSLSKVSWDCGMLIVDILVTMGRAIAESG
jgi:hypothetical protein